jgi:hypothetical protein
LNIFEQTASTNEPTRELVDKEFLIFKIYQMDVKDMVSFSMVGKT